MTCFWNGILASLTTENFNFIGLDRKKYRKPEIFIQLLKDRNEFINAWHVNWNNTPLSNRETIEIKQSIKEYDIKGIHRGHLTSTCEPFLILVSQIFHVNIHHKFINVPITYTFLHSPRKTLKFKNNRGHFTKVA